MIGILFAGQGSQRKNMGLDFYENLREAKEFIDSLEDRDEILKIFNMEEEELTRTKNTQLGLIALETMISHLLCNLDIKAAAGLSIGEYAALERSGVLSLEDTFKIAKYRGQRMEEISQKFSTDMYALMTDDEKKVRKILESLNEKAEFAEVSNINTKGQIVVSGSKNVLDKALIKFKDQKIKAIKLKVSGPFHTSYMKTVENDLREYFKDIDFKDPKNNLYLNLSGGKFKEEDLKDLMARQVSHTVNFKEIIENMILDGVNTFIEIGFGNVLTKFVKKIDKSVKTLSVYDLDSYKKLKENLWKVY